jgi:formylglycine-generating enzyme required for sulfatase activity
VPGGPVGQAKTASPWGTLDQGGNAVEWTDTIAPSPAGNSQGRVWRRLHGIGVLGNLKAAKR